MSASPTRRTVPAAAALAAWLLLAACAGGAPEAGASSPGPYVIEVGGLPANYAGTLDLRTTGGNDVEITMQDVTYSPTVIQAVRGTRAAITLVNADAEDAHTFTIPGVVDVELAPGQRRTISVTTPDEGGLVFSCRFHAESGMRGALNDPAPEGQAESG